MNEIIEKGSAVVMPQYSQLSNGFNDALNVVDDIVLKKYISNINSMELIPIEEVFPSEMLENNINDNVRMFKIIEMVYEKDENAIYKFASVFNTVASTNSAVFVVIKSDGKKAEFYMGIRSQSEDNSATTAFTALKNSVQGQFPGIKIENAYNSEIQSIIKDIAVSTDGNSKCVSCVTGIAAGKNKDMLENKSFVQGLEKFVLSMQGEKYTAVILANSKSQGQISELRSQYEDIYTQLSAFANSQISYNMNYTTSVSTNTSSSVSHGTSYSETESDTTSKSTTETYSSSHTDGTSSSETKKSTLGKVAAGVAGVSGAIGAIGGAAAFVGAALAPFTGGASLAIAATAAGVSAVANGVSSMSNAVVGASKTITTGQSESDTETYSNSLTNGTAHTAAKTHGSSEMKTETVGSSNGSSQGSSQNLQLNITNKRIDDILKRIDTQIQRIDEFENSGLWECAAYFISDGGDKTYVSKVAASSYKALMKGERSGIETSSISTWSGNKASDVLKYVVNFVHPCFRYDNGNRSLPVTATSFVSGDELAINMGLPRKSVCGFPVIEHADFGKEIVKYNGEKSSRCFTLGKIFNMGVATDIDVKLDCDSLTMHTFVTGSTGSGKSNTVYEILNQLKTIYNIPFLVIEPAKGEYKNVFGNSMNVSVYGTNPKETEIIKINPFSFPESVHILEHLDRLIEIFNVCWPMYAAMPAVLKNAVEKSYEDCGWDLTESENKYGKNLYPKFSDVARNVKIIIDSSDYDTENKGTYKGSLLTRLNSLTNGIDGLIFTDDELSLDELFDNNVIVDLSRVGSNETKSLIMGMLVLKLREYRLAQGEVNASLKHITVLEEAHNLLKKTSSEQSAESANLIGRSVEMIANSIAEMRTNGEGFIIADQSPGLLDMSVIRNTNTKIIMRLPDISDRELVGKAANLTENQIEELAKLPCGVAAVYQNEWIQPVLCNIRKSNIPSGVYRFERIKSNNTKCNSNDMLYIAQLLSNGTKIGHEAVLTDILPKLRDNNIPASIQVSIAKHLENPPIKPRMTKLAPIMSALFPFLFNAMKEIHSETHSHSEWTEYLEQTLRNDINIEIDNQTRRDIIQGIVTSYLLNEMNDEASLKEWSEKGGLK